MSYIKGTELIIHNARFDIKFLDYQFNLLGLERVVDYVSDVTDTLQLARNKYRGAKNDLNSLCRRFNIDLSARDYHGALIDCELLSAVYLKLTTGQPDLFDDNRLKRPSKLLSNVPELPLTMPPTQHNNFMKKVLNFMKKVLNK